MGFAKLMNATLKYIIAYAPKEMDTHYTVLGGHQSWNSDCSLTVSQRQNPPLSYCCQHFLFRNAVKFFLSLIHSYIVFSCKDMTKYYVMDFQTGGSQFTIIEKSKKWAYWSWLFCYLWLQHQDIIQFHGQFTQRKSLKWYASLQTGLFI